MRKHLLFLALCIAASVVAENQYVIPGQVINDAVKAASAGDTVKVAAGTYNECVSIKDGVHIFGGYKADFSVRDIDAYPTILDGTGLEKFLLVKYDAGCTKKTVMDGLILENAEHSSDGGGAYLRENCVLSNCIIRNCVTAGGGGAAYNAGTITNCILELCSAEGSGGAVDNRAGGIVENTIIRGCGGKYGTIRNREGATVINCLLYNNSETMESWPASGGIFNEAGGVAINNTIANNYGSMYAGCHSEGKMVNNLLWNNAQEEGFADKPDYVNGDGSKNNASDGGWGKSGSFCYTFSKGKGNMDTKGPHFVQPTSFTGIPTTPAQIAEMRAADWHILKDSPIIDKGLATGAPATDMEGIARPKGSGIDIGCYEFDPNAKPVALTGIQLNADTLFIVEEEQAAFAVIYTPRNATNRNVTWKTDATSVISLDTKSGTIVGLKVGKANVTVTSEEGKFTAKGVVVVNKKPEVIIHHEVLEADALYQIEDYTIPSYIPMWAAKEAARKDSSEQNLQAMRDKIKQLVPKTYPYCLIANINGDPKTRMAFTWFTNEGVKEGKVQLIAKANATAQDFAGQDVITIDATVTTTKALRYAVSTSGIIKATGMDAKTAYKYESHKAMAENLTPGTTYCYRVGYKDGWSDIATFQTASEDEGEFSFILMSDSHIQDQEYVDNARWCAEAAVKNVPEAKFCLFPGDAEETGTAANSEWEWEQWFETSMRPALYQMPFVMTDGNHEDTPNGNWDMHYNTDYTFNQTSIIKPQFKGITYSFVYGDVLFLVFSMQDYWRGSYSESKGTSVYLTRDVGNWFREQVEAHPECKYRVTLCHKNVFSGSGHQEDSETPIFRGTMLPIFADCEIDLALQGHDHCYEVMGPVNPWTRKVIPEAIADVKTVSAGGDSKNMTGLEGGTFTVDDGTLYFIGATCGRKRYYPYTRAEMEKYQPKTKVEDYFDLFTSKFGQPEKPVYTKVTIKDDGIYLDSYAVQDDKGNVSLYNSIKVVRTKEHKLPSGYENVQSSTAEVIGVYDIMGHRYNEVQTPGFYIVKDNQGTKKIYVQ